MSRSEAGNSCWVFKIVDRPKYPDKHGAKYVYDSSHSVRVRDGDRFVYLRKTGKNELAFTGSGWIRQMASEDPPENGEGRKRRIFTAHLENFNEFAHPVAVSPRKTGDENRKAIGLSRNLNDEGLSRSVCRIDSDRFDRIVALGNTACESRG